MSPGNSTLRPGQSRRQHVLRERLEDLTACGRVVKLNLRRGAVCTTCVLPAAYDWRRIHSATPQRNALTCRVGCAFLSDEGSRTGTVDPVIERTSRPVSYTHLTLP